MEIRTRIQNSIDFIEAHLKEDVSIKDIAFNSCYSLYHFQRLFSEYTGIPVMEYVKKRRLSKAAYELCEKNKRVIDLAYDYRFTYEQSFIRSFKREFNITPATFKRKKQNITLCSKISLLKKKNSLQKVFLPSSEYSLSHQNKLYGKRYHFSEDENIENSILFRIKSEFIKRYGSHLKINKQSFDVPLNSFIQHNSAECNEGVFTLAVPADSLKKIPNSFEELHVPLHLTMKTHAVCNKNIHSLRYNDLKDLYWSLFIHLHNQKDYLHNYNVFSTCSIARINLLKNYQTPFEILIPVFEK